MIKSTQFKYDDILALKYGYSPFFINPILYTYIYYVDGLLIDTGQSKARKQIISDCSKLSINQIFVTHHHEDHTGNIIPLAKNHHCKVYGSKLCKEIMQVPPKISLAQKLVWGNRENYNEITAINKEIKTPQYTFEIIPIPGHAKDMLALYEPNKGWLFSADLYINSYIDYFIDNESVLQQINSIKKIIKLDFKVLFCSHNPQLNKPQNQLIKKLYFLESTFEKVEKLHKKGKSISSIQKELKLKENYFVKTLSGGKLSKRNMITSIIRDLKYTSKESSS